MARMAATTLLVAVLACGRGEPSGERAPEDTDTVAAADRTVTEADVVARFRSRLPEGLLRREGACPFECCGYRAWSEPVDLVLLSEPRTEQPVDTIPAGETFEAETGSVFVTGLLLIVPSDTLGVVGDPGDTLAVLDYVGEGVYNVWHDGTVAQVPPFWEAAAGARGTSIGAHETEWWVRARRADGTVGWFRQPERVTPEGADLCS